MKKPRLERLKEVLPLAWTLVRPHFPALLVGLFLILVSRSAGLVLPAMARVFIDDVVIGTRPEKMRLVFNAVFAAALLQAGCSYLLFRVLTVRTIELVADLRSRGIAHLIRLAVPFFDKNRTGALLPRVLHDIESLRILVGSGFIDFAGGIFFAALSAAYMWTISPRLTLVALCGLVAFVCLLVWAFWGVSGAYAERANLMAETSGRLSESLSGIRVIKAYRAEVYRVIGFFDRCGSVGTELMFRAKRRGFRIAQRDIRLKDRRENDPPRFGRTLKANWKIVCAIGKTLFL